LYIIIGDKMSGIELKLFCLKDRLKSRLENLKEQYNHYNSPLSSNYNPNKATYIKARIYELELIINDLKKL